MAERVVNIIGMGISAKQVPDTGENWVINVAYKRIPTGKVNKVFFFDDFPSFLSDDPIIPPVDYTFLKMLKDNPEVEVISRYAENITIPTGEVVGKVSSYPLEKALDLAYIGYFTSSMAYTICYAILEKVDRIRLYGFEVWSGCDSNEYAFQRPCVDFWLAFAMGRGIKIELPYYMIHTLSPETNYFYGYAKKELIKNSQLNK